MTNTVWFDFEKDIQEFYLQLDKAQKTHEEGKLDMSDMISTIQGKIKEAQQAVYANLSGWQ
jgi:acetyl-CoA carboxylase alpha subunit